MTRPDAWTWITLIGVVFILSIGGWVLISVDDGDARFYVNLVYIAARALAGVWLVNVSWARSERATIRAILARAGGEIDESIYQRNPTSPSHVSRQAH